MKTLEVAFATVTGEYRTLDFLPARIEMEASADKSFYDSEGRVRQRVDRLGKFEDSGAE